MRKLIKVTCEVDKDHLSNMMTIIIVTDATVLQSKITSLSKVGEIDEKTIGLKGKVTFDLYIEEEKILYIQQKSVAYDLTVQIT